MQSSTGGAGTSANLSLRGGPGLIAVRLCDLGQVEHLQGEGEWTTPEGERRLDVLVIAGGGGGSPDPGGPGGEPGETTFATLDVRPGDRFRYKVGKGGFPGQDGGDSYFEAI